jgi:hypothetical protein
VRGSTTSAGQVCIGQATTRNPRENLIETLMVGFVLTVVEAEHLFVKVAV